MTNEQIVSEIRNGYSVTDYMQLLYSTLQENRTGVGAGIRQSADRQ